MTYKRDLIIQYRQDDPSLKLQEIGDLVGVSREYARRVLKESGLPTRSYRPKTLCEFCQKPINGKKAHGACKSKYRFIMLCCVVCSKPVQRERKQYEWRMKKGIYSHRVYCNRNCFNNRMK